MVDFPAIFGHEGAGHIKAIGKDVKDKSLKIGDAVLLSSMSVVSVHSARVDTQRFAIFILKSITMRFVWRTDLHRLDYKMVRL